MGPLPGLDPESLIIGTERWDVAQNPGRQVRAAAGTETTVGEDGLLVTREERVNPYYALMELPGEDEPSFVTLRSFVPFDENDDRRELEAFMVGETRPDGTSRLVSYEITSPDALVLCSWLGDRSGRGDLDELLLNRDGSTVEFGDLLMLPIGDSILWVRPLYGGRGDASVPTLQRVIATVGEGERITIASNLTEALNQLFDGGTSPICSESLIPIPIPILHPSQTTDLSPVTTRQRRRRRPPPRCAPKSRRSTTSGRRP